MLLLLMQQAGSCLFTVTHDFLVESHFTLRDCVAVCVILFYLFSCAGRTIVFPHVVIAFTVVFGTIVIHWGVILATIGPRTTQESSPLLSCNSCLIAYV